MNQPGPESTRPDAPGPDATSRFVGGVVDRPVATVMAVLAFMVFGAVSLARLPLGLMPDLAYPTLTLRTVYDGAAPQEVEEQVSRPLEQSLSTTAGLVSLQSISRAGQSDVVLEFAWGTSMDEASQSVRERAALVTLPEGTQRPLLLRYDPSRDPVLRIALAGGDDLFALRRIADEEVARRLEMVPGVAAVKVQGGLEREVGIEVAEDALHARGLTIDDVIARLSSENVNLAGGSIREGDTEYLIRTLNEFRSPEEIEWMVVTGARGEQAFLRDVARVRSAHKERDVVGRLGGEEAVEVSIYKEADANLVDVSRQVRLTLFGDASRDAGPEADEGKDPGEEARKEEKKTLDEAQTTGRPVVEEIGEGMRIQVLSDQAEFVRQSLADVSSSAWQGGLLAIAVLYLFLRHGRSTAIIAAVIPVSVAVAFAPMFLSGLSLNLMSLGGLALSIGMLVDNAVVVLESIHRCREEGDDVRAAAVRGTREVAGPVTASTLTTVAVFLPISFVEGIAGRLFGDLALAVVYSQVASLVVALVVIPVFAALRAGAAPGPTPDRVRAVAGFDPLAAWGTVASGLRGLRGWVLEAPGARRWIRLAGSPAALAWIALRGGLGLALSCLVWGAVTAASGAVWLVGLASRARRPGRRGVGVRALDAFDRAFEAFRAAYDRALGAVLARPSRALVPAALLFVGSLVLVPRLGGELLPELHRGQFVVSLALPVGTPLERTLEVADAAAARIQGIPGIASVWTAAGARVDADTEGGKGEHTADLLVSLAPGGDRREAERAAKEQVRARLRGEPDLRLEITTPTLFSFRTPVEVAVYADDLALLRRETTRIAAALSGVPGLRDVRGNVDRGYPEVQIRYRRDDLVARGLDAGQVARAVRAKVQGRVATELRGGEKPVDVRVVLREGDRDRVARIAEINVNPAGLPPIPLSSVADLEIGEGPSEIRRIDQRRAGVVSAETAGFDLGRITADMEARLASLVPTPGTRHEIGGQSREMAASRSELLRALALAVFLVYVIMACQFESVRQPLTILFAVPLAAVGVVGALAVTGTPLSVLVLIGGIVLAGVVVNNAIVLLDYASLLRARGLSRHEAVRSAALVRLRPILITTLTTVIGLLPLAIGLGEGSELRRPLALTIIAGLSSSTLLTLVVIPAIYAGFEVERRGALSPPAPPPGERAAG